MKSKQMRHRSDRPRLVLSACASTAADERAEDGWSGSRWTHGNRSIGEARLSRAGSEGRLECDRACGSRVLFRLAL